MIVMGKPLRFRRFPHHDHETRDQTKIGIDYVRTTLTKSLPIMNAGPFSTSAGRPAARLGDHAQTQALHGASSRLSA